MLLQNTYFGETVWLFCVLLLLTMLGRAAFVFPFSFLHNWWARSEQLTVKEMIVIWWVLRLIPIRLLSRQDTICRQCLTR